MTSKALSIALVTTAILIAGPALAAKKTPPGAKPLTLGQQSKPSATGQAPTPLGQFGDWQSFQLGGGKTKSCFAISNPKDRKPAGLNRDPATFFVTHRPSEGVHNEISIIAGFSMKDGSDATLKVGTGSYPLYAKAANAWVKNAADEGTVLALMKKSRTVVFEGASMRGNKTVDTYSLSGFNQALSAISKACP